MPVNSPSFMLTNLSPKVLKDTSVNRKIPIHTAMNPRHAPNAVDTINLIAFFILYSLADKGKGFIGNAMYR